jgi:hypothetical protein
VMGGWVRGSARSSTVCGVVLTWSHSVHTPPAQATLASHQAAELPSTFAFSPTPTAQRDCHRSLARLVYVAAALAHITAAA